MSSLLHLLLLAFQDTVGRLLFQRSSRQSLLAYLEQFLIFENLRGFPRVEISDSRYRLEREASLYDESSFQ